MNAMAYKHILFDRHILPFIYILFSFFVHSHLLLSVFHSISSFHFISFVSCLGSTDFRKSVVLCALHRN